MPVSVCVCPVSVWATSVIFASFGFETLSLPCSVSGGGCVRRRLSGSFSVSNCFAASTLLSWVCW